MDAIVNEKLSSINVLPMFALQQENDEFFIIDFITNAIITDANTVLIVCTFELDHSIWTRVFGKLLDFDSNPIVDIIRQGI